MYGESCSLSEQLNIDLNTWHNVSSYSFVLKPRAGHVAGYVKSKNIVLIHGGMCIYYLHGHGDMCIVYRVNFT